MPPCDYTYDFASGAGTDKWAYESGNSGGQPPLPGTSPSISNEVLFTSYTQIAYPDDVSYTTTASGNKYRSQRFVFTVNEDPVDIVSLYVEWKGYSEAASSILYIWNYATVSWEEVGSHSLTTGDAVISATYTSNIGNYIDASGLLHIAATGPWANKLPLHTDYIEVVVTAPCP